MMAWPLDIVVCQWESFSLAVGQLWPDEGPLRRAYGCWFRT